MNNARKDETERRNQAVGQKETQNDEQENWSQDQKNKSYYYDDSYGYEVYNPDEDDDDETELIVTDLDT